MCIDMQINTDLVSFFSVLIISNLLVLQRFIFMHSDSDRLQRHSVCAARVMLMHDDSHIEFHVIIILLLIMKFFL